MSIKNVTANDIALIELFKNDSTAAPRVILDKLAARGHLTITAGKPTLTPKGKRRATALLPAEHDLRLMFKTSADRGPITTDGGSSFQMPGCGTVKIQS